MSLKSAVSHGAFDRAQTEYPQAPETPERGRELPASPVLTIQARRWWAGLDLREVWQRRDLLYLLAWRDVKVRYKQTVLGVAWAVLQPLLTMVVFTLFFGKLARVPSDGIPYPIFAYAGLLPWTFFSNAVTGSGNSLVGNAGLITKVYFPRMIIPGAAVCAGLVDFGIASLILVGLMAYYGVALSAGAVMLIPLAMLTTMLAIGVGMGMSALNVKYRDVRHAMPFAIQLWMFATPIIYPASLIPAKWRWLLWANPLSGLIEGFRAALFHRAFNWPALAVSAAVAVVVLVCSAYVFKQMEREFADVI
ncbi:MAG: ABC transporter permease [Candidatus Binataceae bacterium]